MLVENAPWAPGIVFSEHQVHFREGISNVFGYAHSAFGALPAVCLEVSPVVRGRHSQCVGRVSAVSWEVHRTFLAVLLRVGGL